MAWYNEEEPDKLNFMLVGNCHSGHGLLQSALSKHEAILCHGELLSSDAEVRRETHEAYFGDSAQVADWYEPFSISVEQYLNNKVFDNSLHDERVIGVQLDYQNLIDSDLWEYIDQKCRIGDFCLLHVTRNPIACLVSKLQSSYDRTVCLDPPELIRFVRNHLAAELKLNRLCSDRVVIPYHELLLDFRSSLRLISGFLEVPFSATCIPEQQILNMKHMRSCIGNWNNLQTELPLDALNVLQSPTLF